MTPAARSLWEANYDRLTTPPPGAIGKVTSRAAPHALRLAMIYALLDLDARIGPDHLTAAIAIVDASARCAAHIFGNSVGNPDADRILSALRIAPAGLTRTEIREQVFQKNLPSDRIKAALSILLAANLVGQTKQAATGGAPISRFHAA